MNRDEIDDALAVAQARNMGFYDAMYVMLAREAGALLATRDRTQGEAAAALGVAVLDMN